MPPMCEQHEAIEASLDRLRGNQGETYGLVRELTDRVSALAVDQASLKATSDAGFKMVEMRFDFLAGGMERMEAAIANFAKPQPAPAPVPRRARWSPKTWAVLVSAILGPTGVAAILAIIREAGKP